jgi:hypothetical protein
LSGNYLDTARWRSKRLKHSPMPEALWDAAVSLAREHGVWAVAKALGVSYATLKERTDRHGGRREGEGAAQRDGFVEVNAAQLFGSAIAEGIVVEFSSADGAKLLIRMPSSKGLDVVGLADAFWRRGE